MPDGPMVALHSPMSARNRNSRIRTCVRRFLLGLLLFPVLTVIGFRWIPPPTSAFMIERRFAGETAGVKKSGVRYQWVSWDSISPEIALAVISAEDQKFPHHRGFDLESIQEAVGEKVRGGRLRGASTISQQVAKNLFLWPGRSYMRKGLEAGFTALIELFWPKQRILEVYLNIAEFGDGIYGVEAAAKAFWGKTAAGISREEAALLAAVLPSPRRLRAADPSDYVIERTLWIQDQMEQLGGHTYLEQL